MPNPLHRSLGVGSGMRSPWFVVFLQALQVMLADEKPGLGSIALEQWLLNLDENQNNLERLLKHRLLGSTPVGLEWGLGTCISKQIPSATGTPGLKTTLIENNFKP